MLEYTETFTIPEWSVAYLEYGDSSGLTSDEIAQIERFEAQLAAYGPHTWEWGNDIGFCTDNDIGGLACDCIELHLFVDVPRRAGDPTRAEMIRELISAFRWRRDGRDALRVLRAAGLKSAPIYYPDPDTPGQAVDTEWKITIYQGAAVAVPNSEWPGGPVQVERGNND